jgi:uncharacterized membrane protein
MVPALAIFSAFFFSLGMVLTRIGLRSSNLLSGLLINQMVLLFSSLLIAVLAIPFNVFATRAIIYFMLSGVVGTCFGQLMLFEGINRVGSSIAAPLYDMKPLFAAFGAAVILGEALSLSIALATVIIVIGSAVISLEESGGQIERTWAKKDLSFPVLAGAGFGIAHVIRKIGLNISPEPLLGAASQNAAALAFFLAYAIARRSQQKLNLANRRAWVFFGLCGLATLMGQLTLWTALTLGNVVIVTPLGSTSPVFVLILATLFLKKIERVTWKIWLGTLFIIAGTITLSLEPAG